MNQEEQQVIALAATIQALSTVHKVATQGQFNDLSANAVLQALVRYSPEDTLSAYGGNIAPLREGISLLKKLFNDELNRDIAQYLLTVLTVELKLVRSARMRNVLQTDLQHLAHQYTTNTAEEDEEGFGAPAYQAYELTDSDKLDEFADLYKRTASQIEPRIMIKGAQQFLQQERSKNQIRSLLLAALRGASFFRHYGGSRLGLMMKRSQYQEILESL